MNIKNGFNYSHDDESLYLNSNWWKSHKGINPQQIPFPEA